MNMRVLVELTAFSAACATNVRQIEETSTPSPVVGALRLGVNIAEPVRADSGVTHLGAGSGRPTLGRWVRDVRGIARVPDRCELGKDATRFAG